MDRRPHILLLWSSLNRIWARPIVRVHPVEVSSLQICVLKAMLHHTRIHELLLTSEIRRLWAILIRSGNCTGQQVRALYIETRESFEPALQVWVYWKVAEKAHASILPVHVVFFFFVHLLVEYIFLTNAQGPACPLLVDLRSSPG